jgi:23S rRNA pseudouridine955/2504/2580 synthase
MIQSTMWGFDLLIEIIILYNSVMMKGVTILFEDETILALDKPPGLSVQGGKGISLSLDTLLGENWSPPPRLVHRLDKDTSGLIVAAKTKEEAARLSGLFARGGIHKRYLAVCGGTLPKEGTISEELEIKGQIKGAKTLYKRIALGSLGNLGTCSLAELKPATGREHQLRRHLALKGFPILGDDKHGDFPLNRALKKNLGLRRLLLHAYAMEIPRTGAEPLSLRVPPPRYFLDFLEKTEINPQFPA